MSTRSAEQTNVMAEPITVAIERTVDPVMERYALSWVRQGIDLATHYPGFLGSGWVQAAPGSETWYMLYRFADADTLHAWEASEERRIWVEAGANFAQESKIERRTGIEGWFDSIDGVVLPGEHVQMMQAEPVPPRWKQAVVVWLGFFPMNLLFTFVLGFVPGYATLPLFPRLLLTTALLTPIMVFWILPFVTRAFRPWLLRGREPSM
ncbi:hypothetical protein CLV29_2606 [Naumannella halotolerans]|uniref:ABM domain-containing protein n=2 Tax=Naumannella halotolerans TaxID=993414 RepID=A0A4R7J1Z2_9ACTN|nr:hypothetical protein CLV29_2606 [Naumannella halotolerans]